MLKVKHQYINNRQIVQSTVVSNASICMGKLQLLRLPAHLPHAYHTVPCLPLVYQDVVYPVTDDHFALSSLHNTTMSLSLAEARFSKGSDPVTRWGINTSN